VARAKRTDRAEARRRYRAEMAGTDDLGEEAEEEGSPAPGPARQKAVTARTPTQTGRLGITAAFRQSIHPVNVRADIAALPMLVRSKALLIPVGLSAATAILFVVIPPRVPAGSVFSQITFLLMQYFVWAPPIGAVFVAGFLAPRASWLIGLLVGVAASVFFTVMLVSGLFNTSMVAVQALPIASDQYAAFIGQWFVLSAVMGALFASGAAWYRRFLQLSNPNRGRRPDSKGGSNSGRSRTQKAGARR
jgi:hypothetical protein